jgi:GT2 family glycosyltransferase
MRYLPTTPAPGVSAVVINYRTPSDLSDHLESIYTVSLSCGDDRFLDSITVVNVDPGEDDIDVAEMWCSRINRVRPDLAAYMFVPWNCGYAFACNMASRYGNGGVLAFFNADTTFSEPVFSECYEALATNPTWGILGPRQIDETGAITHAGIFGPDAKPQIRGWKSRSQAYDDVRSDCYSVSGSAYFVKRKVWDQLTGCETYRRSVTAYCDRNLATPLGAFLPTRHYYEETYCSLHARAHGWKVAYLGTATMIHKWHKASAVGGYADRRLLPESREIFRQVCSEHGIVHD